MKKLSISLAYILLSNSLFIGIGRAQQGASIEQLKEQVAKLEVVDRDANVPADVKNINRSFLETRRTQLRKLLEIRIAALQSYRSSVGASLTASERQTVDDTIRNLENDLRGLGADRRDAVENIPTALSTTAKRDDLAGFRITDTVPSSMSRALEPVSCEACKLLDRAFIVDVSTGDTFFFNKNADPQCQTKIVDACKDPDKTRFGKDERIPVVVINKNPFLYKYTITVQETAIVEDALAPFFKAFSPIFAGAFPTSVEQKGLPPLQKDTNEIPENCPKKEQAALAYEAIRIDMISMNARLEEVESALDDLKAKYQQVASAYDEALVHFARTRAGAGYDSLCQELCTNAQNLQKVLGKDELATSIKNFQIVFEKLKENVNRVNGKINDFLASFPECQPRDPNTGLSILRQRQNDYIQGTLAIEMAKMQDMLAQIIEKKKEYDKMKSSLDTLGARPDMLQETRFVGPFDTPTNVAVKVEYKSVQAPESEASKEAAKFKLNFGGDKRFALSGGIAYAFLERPEIRPLLGFERNQIGEIIPGQATPVTIIGLSENSRRRIVPMLMLNTRITNYRDNNLFFSVGITGSSDSTGTNIDYLIGPSLNFLDSKIFLTYGLYGGKVQRLNEDLFFGLKVPDATSADKLVQKNFIWKSGFGITYKIR